jgi:hypothetical protein
MPLPVLLALVPSLAAPQDEPAALGRPSEPAAIESRAPRTRALSRASTLAERVARDERLSFHAGGARRARERLEQGLIDPHERALALFALGAGGGSADLPRLSSSALAGTSGERRSAILALGELGADGLAALCELLGLAAPAGGRPDATRIAGLEEEWALAVARVGGERGLATLDELAQGALPPLAERAAALAARLRGAVREGGSTWLALSASPALDGLLDLRWQAARSYGLVGGQSWRELLLADLVEDEEFRDRLSIGVAIALAEDEELDGRALDDHLLDLVLAGGTPARLRGPAVRLASELERLVRSGAWRPAGAEEWRAMLEEIAERRAEVRATDLLRLALETSDVPRLAGIGLLRSGAPLPKPWIVAELGGASVRRRAALIETLGDRGEAERIDDLLVFVEPSQPTPVRGAALVALARLGHAPSAALAGRIALGPPSVERRELAGVLARATHDERVATLVQSALAKPDLEPEARVLFEIALGLQGLLQDKSRLRAWLAHTPPTPLRRYAVRALARDPDERDLAVLRELFPVEDDLELNLELATHLALWREPDGSAALRAILWSAPWHQGVLAGGALLRAVGLAGLIDELDSAPRSTSAEDLRRVGFALGEWGGIQALETLSRRRREDDPVLQGAYLGYLAARSR